MIEILYEFAQRDPLGFISILVGIPILLLFLMAATIKRIHPLVVWIVLTASSFGFSQVFPENRNQRVSIAVMESIISAILVWWWFGRIAPRIRQRLSQNRRRE